MKKTLSLSLFSCLFLFLSSYALAQLTPTQQLAQQRQQQIPKEQQAPANGPTRVVTRRLPAPCIVPDQWYPLRTCKVSTSPQECGRGYNAWQDFASCCAPAPGSAFPQGCTNFNKEVECWVPTSFYPERTCGATNNITRCSYNWGQWGSEDECCSPGRAFPEGCSMPEACWVGTDWSPERKCSSTDDRSICNRGWGVFNSADECCTPGKAFEEGCGLDQEALVRIEDENPYGTPDEAVNTATVSNNVVKPPVQVAGPSTGNNAVRLQVEPIAEKAAFQQP